MHRFRAKAWIFVTALIAAAAFGQTVAEKPTPDVRRVGMRLKCTCGCGDSVATCSMLECEKSKPAKERIARMQAVGLADKQIVDAFVRDNGPGIYLAPPSAYGWVVPYASVGFGLLAIWLFIRKYRQPKPQTEVGVHDGNLIDDPDLAKYREQIERDMANLE